MDVIKVLNSLGYPDDDSDLIKKVEVYINIVKGYLINAGAPQTVGDNDNEFGCILIGVNDLLNNDSGKTDFSPAFKILANQVCRR